MASVPRANINVIRTTQLAFLFFSIYIIFVIFKEFIYTHTFQVLIIDTYHNLSDSSINKINKSNVYHQNLALITFLSQYNVTKIIKFIREIESNIHFHNIYDKSNAHGINTLYNTGISPHFYDNMHASLSKSCKHLKFSYRCPTNITDKGELFKWTLKINETNLQSDTKLFLYTLQHQYDIYTDLHRNYIERVNRYSSPYEQSSFNVFFYGNSHMRQIIEGDMCLFDAQHQDVVHYLPKLQPQNTLFNFSDYCLGAPTVKKWNDRDWNGLHLDQKVLNAGVYKPLEKKNIFSCRTDFLYIKHNNNATMYYAFGHTEEFKSMFRSGINSYLKGANGIHKFWKTRKEFLYETRHHDIIIFNLGNRPMYDYRKQLLKDLQLFGHVDKPVIMMSSWRNDIGGEQTWLNKTELEWLYNEFDNIIFVNLYERNFKYLLNRMDGDRLNRYLFDDNWNHFCQPGVPEHHILAMNELINLLGHVYH